MFINSLTVISTALRLVQKIFGIKKSLRFIRQSILLEVDVEKKGCNINVNLKNPLIASLLKY